MNVAELFSSDFTLIAATLAGLALTTVGILRDLSTIRPHKNLAPELNP
jgi:hypothetical protein